MREPPCRVTIDLNNHLCEVEQDDSYSNALKGKLSDMVKEALLSGDDTALETPMVHRDFPAQLSKIFEAVEPFEKLSALADFRNWMESVLSAELEQKAAESLAEDIRDAREEAAAENAYWRRAA